MRWTESVLIPLCFAISACGSSEAQNDTNTQVANNIKPIAKITDLTPLKGVGKSLKFNGLNSSDADGDSLTYHWNLIRVIDQTSVPLEQSTGQEIALNLPEQGNYSLRLYVNDGHEDSITTEFEFLVPEQVELSADAGQDFTVKKGQVISLNGSNSKAKDETISDYHWEILDKPSDSRARIFKNKSVKTNFVADAVGSFTVQLTVTNKSGLQAKDSILINSDALEVNSSPAAIINVEKSKVAPNEIIQLDGSQSYDPDRFDRLKYRWSIVSSPVNSQPILSKASAKKTAFSADTDGLYRVMLTVSDGNGAQSDVIHDLTVQSDNQKPIAVLGADKIIKLTDTIALSCESCYDPEGNELSYEWLLLSAPTNSNTQIVSKTSSTTEFTPDIEGEYLLAVRVSDGVQQTTSNTQLFDVRANQKPTAQISPVSSTTLGSSIVLDGTTSSDPEGAELSYEWQVVSQPGNDALDTSTIGKATLLPSQVGTYVFSLKTYDGTLYSDPVTQTVLVSEDLAPVITILGGNNKNATSGELVTLDATASYDPEGEALAYQWELLAPVGSSATLYDSASGLSTFTPDLVGLYRINLTVSDLGGLQSTSTIEVVVTEHTDLLSGTVKGRIVDTTLAGVPYAEFTINDELHTADQDGVYVVSTQVETGGVITLQTKDTRLISAKHVTTNISQSDFVINLGESFVPVNQLVDTYVWGCADYAGPQEVNIKFKMIDTFPAMNKFKGNFEKSFLFTVEGNEKISLPATATYEITTSDEVSITSLEPHKTIYYSPAFGAVNIIDICN